jgi:hypothetical protein
MAQKRFDPAFLDYYGFAGWDRFGAKDGAAKEGITALREGNTRKAYRILRDEWKAKPTDVVVLHALVMSARAEGRIDEFVRVINSRIIEARAKSAEIPQPELFAVVYVGSLCAYFRLEGDDSAPLVPDDHPLWMYYHIGASEFSKGHAVFRDRASRYLYVNALWARHRIAETRRVARDFLAKDPSFAEMKLLMARTYSTGVVSRTIGGQPVPVPEDEKPDPRKYATLAEEVCVASPKLDVAWYEAGIAWLNVDRAKGKLYLRKYMERSQPGTYRYARALYHLNLYK